MRFKSLSGGVLCWGLALAALGVPAAPADVVLDWNEVVLDAIRVDRTAPPRAARILAMTQIAVFNAVNAIDGSYRPYADFSFPVSPLASREAAASQAARDVLVALFPAQSTTFDTYLAGWLSTIPAGAARNEGISVGAAAAAAILALRQNDGASATVSYTAGTDPGDWQPTPPAFSAPALPQWPNVTPFCMSSGKEFRRNGPPPLTSVEYTVAYNEVKELGSKTSTTRTAEQTLIAQFWVDGPGTATPPGHMFQIARDVAILEQNTTVENARLFALIGLAVADAGICSWDNKYVYDHWRPITAIRAADADGNDATEADVNWEPLIPTPPFPAYTSGHSTFSGAGLKIIELFYGRDDLPFTTTSDDVPGVSRSFQKLSEAADEAGRSRIYGGIHWEYDNQDGLAAGRELALRVFDQFLTPVNDTVVEIPSDQITRCGPLGFFPLGLTLLPLVGVRRLARRRRR